MLFLFWLIRIFCLIGFLINLIVIKVYNIPSFIYLILGIFASFNIYVMGLIAHETYKSLPSAFILFRVIQFILLLATRTIAWEYLIIHTTFDVVIFILFLIDNRYDFILIPENNNKDIKTQVKRSDRE